MDFKSVKVVGADALKLLAEHRSRYPSTGDYPFLIGDGEELERIEEASELNQHDPEANIRRSSEINRVQWIAKKRQEAEHYGFSAKDTLGEWPDEITEKGSILLHKDILTGKIKPEIYLGLAPIRKPWHLPAMLRYGGWNDCPFAEVHCAFHHQWFERFGAEITGMSGDVVECTVANPPRDREKATALAWEQYWYCTDIVDQGCESVSNLAATLINSHYWYFWWD